MSATDKLRTLQGELGKTLQRIAEIEEYHMAFRHDFPPVETRRNYDLVLLADIVTDYYTCLETGFVRISKLFENQVDAHRWHRSLLERMAVEIPTIRARVLLDDTFGCLDELMRFRHVRRYYVDRRYERERMALLEKTFLRSLPLVRRDLDACRLSSVVYRYDGFGEPKPDPERLLENCAPQSSSTIDYYLQEIDKLRFRGGGSLSVAGTDGGSAVLLDTAFRIHDALAGRSEP